MTLVQHWKLDDNAASTTVVATVGTNGTLNGGDNTSVKSVAGPGGSITLGFDMNGTDDSIDISGSSLSYADGVAFSVNAWAEWDASLGRIIGSTAGTTSSRIIKLDDTHIAVYNSAGSSVSFAVPSLGTSAWCHVLVCRAVTTNSVRCFVNGTESSSGALVLTGAFSPNELAKNGVASFHDGKLAQIKIFDSDESANVASLYAEGVSAGGGVIPVFMNQYRQRRV
jgi:hypothetical protein